MNLHLKYILFGASILLFASLFHSCSDNYQDGSYAEDNNYAIATKQSYTVSADEQTIVLAINDASHDNSINWSLTTLPSWIKASTTWGKGTGSVSLEIMQNSSFTQNREAVIFIEAHGGNNWSTKLPVIITQDALSKTYHNNHEYVDLGLPSGLKWATCNIGASAPEQVGNYYAWGEIATKPIYTDYYYKYYSGNGYTKYTHCAKECFGTPDKKSTLELSDDAAHQSWGGSWRMPTKTEAEELISKCRLATTTINGVNVQKVIGPNGKFIVMPNNSIVSYNGEIKESYPCIWTSSHYQGSEYNGYAWCLDNMKLSDRSRFQGRQIRPVFK